MSNDNLALTPDGLRAYNRWHLILAAILLLLLFLLPAFFGIGPGSWRQCGAPAVTAAAAPAAAPAPAPAPAPVAAAPRAAAAVQAPPAAKIYFASAATELPADSGAKLADIVTYLKANPTAVAVLSGYHDPRGSKETNELLALNRARAVRASLEAAGIAKERIDMAKPQVTTGSGPDEEARRVEVTVR